MRISDWSSDVCSSDLQAPSARIHATATPSGRAHAWRAGRLPPRSGRTANRRPIEHPPEHPPIEHPPVEHLSVEHLPIGPLPVERSPIGRTAHALLATNRPLRRPVQALAAGGILTPHTR